MKSSGLYFFKDFSDHSLVLLPNDFIGDKLRRQGNFQREAVVKIANLLKQKNILPKQALIMEIGANIGTHTIYLERALSCSRIIAVEPDPENASLLRMNVRINGLENKVDVVEMAASDRAGLAEMVRVHCNSGASRIVGDRGTSPSQGRVAISVDTAEAILAKLGLTPESVDFLWIDVEGHEPQVLAGMPTLLALHVPIFLEFSPAMMSEEARSDLSDLLFSHYGNVLHYEADFRPLDRATLDAIERQVNLMLL